MTMDPNAAQAEGAAGEAAEAAAGSPDDAPAERADEAAAAAASQPAVARIDLHCHSRYSSTTDQWMWRQFGLRESYTDPSVLYRQAKTQGMTHVTLTDRDTIEGALRLAHHEDFVIGEEVTAFFPSEALHADVLVWGLDERQHGEIQQRRFDIRELVAYLRAEGLAHGLAHPCSFRMGGLRLDHYEQLMLLFGLWELLNGSSSQAENEVAARCAAVSGGLLPRLAEKHDRKPLAPALLGFAGSDDRSGLDIGVTFTEIDLERPGDDPLPHLMNHGGRLLGSEGSVQKIAHNAISVVLQGGETEDAGGRLTRLLFRGAVRSNLAWGLLQKPRTQKVAGRTLGLVTRPWRRSEARTMRRAAVAEAAAALAQGSLLDVSLQHERIAALIEGIWQRTTQYNLEQLAEGGMGEALRKGERLKALLQAQILPAPYFSAAAYRTRQRVHAREVAALLEAGGLLPPAGVAPGGRIAMFTDTYDEVNGVATVLHALVGHAARSDWPFALVTCGAERASEPAHESFAAVDVLSLSVYQEFPFAVAPVFEVLRWCEDTDVRLIHAATPGPVGMVAALLARSLGIPLVGTYHTDVPRLGFFLTRDRLLEELLWSYVRWFYGQCEVVFCPSRAVKDDLSEHGVRARFEPLDQAVDERHFTPERRRAEVNRELGGGKKVVLWVGRVSAEKGLAALAAVNAELLARRNDVQLVVVGDGPYRDEFQRMAPQASFLGVRVGEELAEIYASADVFVFPGLAETFWQVLLEAAASGLPSVVTAGAGVDENVVRGVTALEVAPGDVQGFVAAVERLLDDDALRASMGAAARRHALRRSWPVTFAHVRRVYDSLLS
jgi:glycosyltransferase involved in cell wall biosynthesis